MKRIALAVALGLAATAWAKPPVVPTNWRELRFGTSEAEVQKLVLAYRKSADRAWERLPLTAMPIPDAAGRKVTRVDLDEKRFHAWMIGQLDPDVSTVRAWFDGGKLIALQLMVALDEPTYVANMAQVYGAKPEKVTFRFEDRTQGATEKPADVPVSLWRGAEVTALIFQTSGWGPELLLVSNAALPALLKVAQKPGSAAGGATRF